MTGQCEKSSLGRSETNRKIGYETTWDATPITVAMSVPIAAPMLSLTLPPMLLATVQTVMLMAVPKMDTSAVSHTTNLGASLRDRATLSSPLRGLDPSGGYPSRLRSLRSLRAPLARRLADALRRVLDRRRRAAFDYLVGTTAASSSRRRFAQRSSQTSPRSPSPAAPAAGIASGLGPRAPVRRRVPAPPRTGSRTTRRSARRTRAGAPAERARTSLRTAPCSSARTSAGTTATASGSVLRTTACGSRRTDRHSIAVAAPLRRLRRRRFPRRSCRTLAVPDRPGRPWVSHPTHR